MKLRHTTFVVVALILAVIVLRPARTETASPSLVQLAAQVDTLQARVATLETTVSTQSSQIASLQTAVSTLQTGQATLQAKLQFVTVSGTEMYITGANLNVRSGSGATDADTNGLGNLIVGYNENVLRDDGTLAPRIGSHNIVVGGEHGYSSYGGLVAGWGNYISGRFASVTGGRENTASGWGASVSGGHINTASGFMSSVTGGVRNTASGG